MNANEKPILFSGEMVLAILDGRKTQTRRIMKPQPWEKMEPDRSRLDYHCAYGQRGGRMWVKETFCPSFANDDESVNGYCYRATHNGPDPLRWKPSIFMPREASRIMLEITGIRVQRVQEITEEDAMCEGCDPLYYLAGLYSTHDNESMRRKMNHRAGFRFIWEKIHGQKAWDENPWVLAIEFRRIKP